MRVWATWSLGVAGAIALVATLAASGAVEGVVVAGLYGVIVLGAAVGTGQIARRRRSSARSDAADGVERDLATQAGSAAFPVAVVAILLLGLVGVVLGEIELAAWTYGAAVLAVTGYWVIYAVLRRRTL